MATTVPIQPPLVSLILRCPVFRRRDCSLRRRPLSREFHAERTAAPELRTGHLPRGIAQELDRRHKPQRRPETVAARTGQREFPVPQVPAEKFPVRQEKRVARLELFAPIITGQPRQLRDVLRRPRTRPRLPGRGHPRRFFRAMRFL